MAESIFYGLQVQIVQAALGDKLNVFLMPEAQSAEINGMLCTLLNSVGQQPQVLPCGTCSCSQYHR
jgi:hypothetical protein